MASFRVISAGLNVRLTPSSATDENLFPPPLIMDDIVEQIEISADEKWFRVRFRKDGITREGWVAARFLAPEGGLNGNAETEEPPWMVIARRELGVAETDPDNLRILEYLATTTNLSRTDMEQDETAWCSAFVNWCMKQAGYVGTNHALARSWANWNGGVKNDVPSYGAIAVFRRLTNGVDQGKGHVGFFVKMEDDQIFLLGGNQNDAVNVHPRSSADLICYVHPSPLRSHPAPDDEDQPVAAHNGVDFRPQPNGRVFEASLQTRLERIADLEAQLTDDIAEAPEERAEIEREIDEERRDYRHAEIRARHVAVVPSRHNTDAEPNPNWKAAWAWTTADFRGRPIIDPDAPFNDSQVRNKPGEAQGSNIERVVQFLDVENTSRYRQQDTNTFCTVFVYDVTFLLSAEIPIKPNRLANDMCNWLESGEAQGSGWRRLNSVEEAQEYANAGFPVIASQRRPDAGQLKFLTRLAAPAQKWRLGVNLRELAYYGSGAAKIVGTQASQRAEQLTVCRDNGIKLIRFFASRHDFKIDDCIDYIRKTLDLLWNDFEMQAIVCLDDSLNGSDTHMAGKDKYHAGPHGHLTVEYWRKEAYWNPYIPNVRKIVTAFKDHPAVALWELGNEFGLYPQIPAPLPSDADNFYKFVKVASQEIRNIAPANQLISIGLITTHAVYVQTPALDRYAAARRLYELPTVDAVGVHYYKDNQGELANFIQNDWQVAHDLSKPFYVGEMGALINDGDRPAYYAGEVTNWKGEALTVMPWQLDSFAQWDTGICDTRGFGKWRDGDYQPILDKLKLLA